MDDYDVFLNHRGPDVKVGFIAHLYQALRSAGLHPFLDKKSLVEGNPAFGSIDAALAVAKVHVAVVSRGYAESKYCLSELVAMMRSGKPVIPVFYDVEPAALRRVEKGPFAEAFEKHKLRETTEQVEEWIDALRRLADVSGFCFRLSDYNGDEADLKRKVMDAILRLMPQSKALQVEPHLVGNLKEHVGKCVEKLENMSGGTCLLGLVGTGGIGKTTLAKEIYNHLGSLGKFQAVSFLKIDHNSNSSTEGGSDLVSRLQKQLLWDLLSVTDDNWGSYTDRFRRISRRGPVLVFLDDVVDRSVFDELILDAWPLAAGSCIIVTSRDRHVLKDVGKKYNFYLHEVPLLGSDYSERLFNWHAFGVEEAPEEFKALAESVSEGCGGLPLALKVVGCSLYDKRSDEDRKYIWPEAIAALKEDVDFRKALKWSYDHLSEVEKMMFVDIACVFYEWEKKEALEMWRSCKECASCCGCGAPHTSLRHLIDKSLIELKGSEYSAVLGMHGLLREMGQAIGKADGSHLCKDKAIKAMQGNNHMLLEVRALNLASGWKRNFEAGTFANMPKLHFLECDGCEWIGNLGGSWEELRWLKWRNMPLTQSPSLGNLRNLVSLDFSQSTKLAEILLESHGTLEAFPNLLKLNLFRCPSITTLPNSIGHLSKLQSLYLGNCSDLRKLPSSLGQLTALEELHLSGCRRLEALPESITTLSRLRMLLINGCFSMLELPPAMFGLMTGLRVVFTDLVAEWQAVGIGHLNALFRLTIMRCNDEIVTKLDKCSTLRNLNQLGMLDIVFNNLMTKLPETIGLLANLGWLNLWRCYMLRELPNSIGQLRVLKFLCVRECNSLETLPETLGALTSLQILWIVKCPSLRELPMSIGHLSKLEFLSIERCTKLKSLPHSLSKLDGLQGLQILECGRLEDLGVKRVLQGLRIWGCTSTSKLPGLCLLVVDANFLSPACYQELVEFNTVSPRKLKVQVGVAESNDCGFLRVTQDIERQGWLLQRVYISPCVKN